MCGPYVVVLVRGTNGTWYHRKRFADGSWTGWINSYWYSCE